MKNTISKGWLSLLIVMGILILDQIIKIAVKTNMYYNESIRITDWFYIHFVDYHFAIKHCYLKAPL